LFRYLLRRILATIPVLIGVSILVFLFLHFIPGDPAVAMVGERSSQERIEEVREQLGLNRPLVFNLPYSYNYICPEGFEGTVIDLIVAVIPAECQRDVQYQQEWALLRVRETSTVNAVRVIDPGQPTEEIEITDLEKSLRLIGVRTVEELALEPGVAKEFPTRNGHITVALDAERVLFSDLFNSQYFIFAGRILRGDLGTSIQGGVSISAELARRFPSTMEMAFAAMALAVVVGVPLGIIAAIRRNSWIDSASMFLALVGVSFPVFVLGLIAIYLFSVQLRWFPSGQRLDPGIDVNPITGMVILDSLLQGNTRAFFNAIHHLILPCIVLSTIPLAIIARITRSAMLEVLHQDYIRTAYSKGIRERVVVVRHALRNALLPVVTVIGLTLGGLLSGALLTETIFAWPGIGKWLYDAISGRDYPIVQSVTLVVALVYVTVNLLVDLSYAFLDPRIRYR
jgi:peptide/nickel transport system permease protein